ncbi:MAG TPA: alanine racemase [Gemmatimonas sp.]|nr:alanine racemase [Gemmatimonas sp.]
MTSSIYAGSPVVPDSSDGDRSRTLSVPATGRAWLDVDLDAVRRNVERLHRAAGVPLVLMLKADAYGLGATAVARALEHAGESVWGLGVATVQEAAELRAADISARVLCCTPLLPEEFEVAQALLVRPALQRGEDIIAWSRFGAPWHLSIDTGMSRAGVRWDEVETLRAAVMLHPPEGVFTHFHSADDDAARELQEQRFEHSVGVLRDMLLPAFREQLLVHCDNTAAIAARALNATTSPGQLARPGIGVYGCVAEHALALEQPVHLRARVVDLRTVRAGETVSYGGSWCAPSARRIATVSAGHGDGYRRGGSGARTALLHGVHVPVTGFVTMDMTMLDVTDHACAIGDVVTLLGRDGDLVLRTEDVADEAGLSPYELLVGLRLRVPRRYHDVHQPDR